MTSNFVSEIKPAPKQFGKYIIEKELGRGGMGVVYKAYDPQLQRYIALKIILNASQKSIERFTIESAAMAQLNHINLVSIYEFGKSPQPYFAMEYIEGKTLDILIKQKKTKPLFVIDIMIKICSCLQQLHEQNIVHRDIKPANIIIAKNGEPKVMDLGLAKFVEHDNALSTNGDLLGTPNYMPPEQISGKASNITDIYALGATMYEALTHEKVYQGNSYVNLLFKVLNEDPIPLCQINPKISPVLEKICLKCLQKEPKKRYQNCTSLSKALTNFKNARRTMRSEIKKKSKNNAQEPLITVLIVLVLVLSSFSWWLYSSNKKLRNKSSAITQSNKTKTSNKAKTNNEPIKNISPSSTIKINSDNYYTIASKHLGKKEYKLALKNYNKAIEISPQTSIYLKSRSLTQFYLKNYQEAIEDINLAIKLDGTKAEYHSTKGAIFLYLKKYTTAMKCLEKAQQLNSKLDNIYFYKGEIYFIKAQYKKALVHFKKACQLNISYYNAYDRMGHCHFALFDYKNAIINWEKAKQLNYKVKEMTANIEKARMLIQTSTKLPRSEKAEKYFLQGKKLYLQNKITEALHCLNKSIKEDINHEASHNLRGVVYKNLNNLPAAIKNFSRAIELKSKNHNSYYNRGVTYKDIKKYELSMSDFNKAIEISPKNSVYLNSRSQMFYLLGKLPQALKDINAAIKLDPQKALYYANRANIYYITKQYKQALHNNNKSIKIAPKVSQFWHERGLTCLALQKRKLALKNINRAIEIDNSQEVYYINKAVVLLHSNQYPGAMKSLNIAEKLNNKSYMIYYRRGEIYLKTKKYIPALKHLERSLQLNKIHSATYVLMGDCYSSLQKHKQAIDSWLQAIKLGFSDEKNVRQKIKRSKKYLR